jgi:hypothetical protein
MVKKLNFIYMYVYIYIHFYLKQITNLMGLTHFYDIAVAYKNTQNFYIATWVLGPEGKHSEEL